MKTLSCNLQGKSLGKCKGVELPGENTMLDSGDVKSEHQSLCEDRCLLQRPYYSCVGIWTNDGIETLANDEVNRTTATCVGLTDSARLLGDA